MRKLATIQKIKELIPIEGADKIELARILGWQVVVEKDKFKVGDLVVYCEPDSVLPDRPEFEFLGNKKRIKTIKLRGARSEGIVFSIADVLPATRGLKEGRDVTKELGVTKYLNPTELRDMERNMAQLNKTKFGKVINFVRRYPWGRKLFPQKPKTSGSFPGWIRKTDEIRIQNTADILNSGVMYKMHEKVDGSSMTIGARVTVKDEVEVVLCSRNRNIILESMYWGDKNFVSTFHALELDKVIRELLDYFNKAQRVVIQGELMGPGIQGNIYKLDKHVFYMFNLVVDGEYLDYEALMEEDHALSKILENVDKVPYLGEFLAKDETVDSVLEKATFKSKLNPKTGAEGIVFRNYDGKQLSSFKAVSPNYLIKKQKLDEKEEQDEKQLEI